MKLMNDAMNALYAAAANVLPTFAATVAEIATAAQAEALVAPLKGRARAEQKCRDEYAGDVSRLTDIVRGAIICDNMVQVAAAFDALVETCKVVKIKDRFARPVGGYRDYLVLVSVGGVTCELQIHLRSIFAAKEHGIGHATYEIVRVAGESVVDQLVAAAASYAGFCVYEAAYAAAL